MSAASFSPVAEDTGIRDVAIREGEMFLLPGGVPHSPQRPDPESIGMVVEPLPMLRALTIRATTSRKTSGLAANPYGMASLTANVRKTF